MDSGQGSAQTKQAKKSKKWPKVLLAVVLVASLAGNAFLVFEKLNTKQEEKSKVGTVCGDEIISKFNNVYETYETYEQEKGKITSEIKAKSGFEEDVNCLIILQNTEKITSELYKKIEELVNKGQNPSLKIRNVRDLDSIKPLELRDPITTETVTAGKGGL